MVESKEPEITLSLSNTPTSVPATEQPWVTKARKDLPQLKASRNWRDLPGAPGGLGLICGQETRSHMLQLRPSTAKEKLETPKLENDFSAEVLLQEWEFWAAGSPQPGGPAPAKWAPTTFGFEDQKGLI